MENLTPEFEKTLNYLIEVEEMAQNIQSIREQKCELANTKNKLREAFRALQKTDEKRSFLKIGPLFVRKSTDECRKVIHEEMDRLEVEHEELSAELKEKVSKLRDLEHEPRIEGIGLKPLSGFEARTIAKGFGHS